MLGYNRTITRTNINVLINIGPGAGGGRKRRGKKGNLPNTFDEDCSLSQIRFQGSPQLSPHESLVGGDPGNEFEFYNGDVAKVQTCIKQTPTGPTLKKNMARKI